MGDYEDGQAYSRSGGKIHAGQRVSDNFYNGVRSNEIHQANMQYLSERMRASSGTIVGTGPGPGIGGIPVLLGIGTLFVAPPIGLVLIGLGIVIAVARLLIKILSSPAFWVLAGMAVVVFGLLYFHIIKVQ